MVQEKSKFKDPCPNCKCSAFAYIGDFIYCFVCHKRWVRKTGEESL